MGLASLKPHTVNSGDHQESPFMMCNAKLMATFASLLALASAGPSVQLDNGVTVQGRIAPDAPQVAEFLGIPYAAPPLDDLRWEPPQPYVAPQSFANGAVLNATALPPSCWQYISVIPAIQRVDVPEFMIGDAGMDEDCLTASFWVPSDAVPAGNQTEGEGKGGLPVVIWFYGGGFETGGTDVPYQMPQKWVQHSQSHIFVTFNYRMALFGFPNSAALEEQNLGLMDQRLAVEWIRDNVAKFGGDPERMTIWGQSAGAIAVDYWNFAYTEDPIVKAFIMDSGTAHLDQLMNHDTSHSNFTFVAQQLGCGNLTDARAELTCMRKLPAEKLENFYAVYKDSQVVPTIGFSPQIDNKIVFANYTEKAARGEMSDLPAIIGFNAAEGLFLAPYNVNGPDPAISESLSYNYFWCSTTKTTNERLAAGRTTYRYFHEAVFNNTSPRPWMGAYHGSELPLIFGTHADFRGNSTPFEYELSRTMMDAYTAFIKDPAAGLGAIGWPAYTADSRLVRSYGENDTVLTTVRTLSTIEENCAKMRLL
ncbi:carboxylesterase [Colletotrichum graminicola M1.001]|uniref:Carboxylic ester hydrolase n=1 Tax=Colletotrichum graminicola (strain M1.001 / M2 / FGSC 10212) TaxID=645133 RepID=E3QU56_COLGM|nr:carboxylesterase [Colletotrichum graminicola M1.001]EFQ34394.1 carboxylesterase [Colletotrichum graminicola M1.001]